MLAEALNSSGIENLMYISMWHKKKKSTMEKVMIVLFN